MSILNINSKKINFQNPNAIDGVFINDQYSFYDMLSLEGKLQKILIASAYCDPEIINEIFKIFINNSDGRSRTFQVFIDRSSSKIIGDKQLSNKYKKINKKIIDECTGDDNGIYLVNINGKLFHTKLIYLESTKENKLISGSINLTKQGTDVHQNEEIIIDYNNINTTLQNNINIYFDTLKQNLSIRVDNDIKSNKISSARDFFLSGKLFLQLDRLAPLNFTLNLPQEYFNSDSVHPILRHKTSGTVNLLSSWMYINKSNQENKNSQYEKNDSDENENKRVTFKTWCIETDFGFFAPYEFIRNVRSFYSITDDKINYLNNEIDNMIKEKENFNKEMLKIFEEIKENSYQNNTPWSININNWNTFFYNRINRLLKDDDYRSSLVERMSSGLCEISMPDIWNDPVSLKLFKFNFINFLKSKSSTRSERNKSTRNKFIQAILAYFDIPDDFEDLEYIVKQDKFINKLKEISNSNM